MDHTHLWIGIIVVLALGFDFSNGVHDAANAIATTVTTRALSMGKAVAMAAILNFVGAIVNTEVAKFIGTGLVDAHLVTLPIVAAALIGAIVWNLFTWWLGLPSSSSHALIGGLMGAAIFAFGPSAVHVSGLTKTVIGLVTSPLLGFGVAYLLMRALLRLVQDRPFTPTMRAFRRLQVVSAAFMAFSHGSNDAQKTMGVVTLALISANMLNHDAAIPKWVILASAAAMAAGTALGGWRIIKTMGSKLVDLTPAHGFAAETAAAAVIMVATHLGIPISTTHVIASSILGVGATRRARSVRWGTATNIVLAWVFTIPGAGLVGGLMALMLKRL
ncbi:MAG: inorganic phosphate transporter [Capsulimonas sp.]|uniref:inorganic phosphate transporter n=1 Tax=Capsulimonas sp. TaxID=2494211 RepID=UPI003265E501